VNQYFATVARGLELLAAVELEELGAKNIEPGFCGVQFQGDQRLLYQVNLWARIPFRILWQIYCFPCNTAEDLDQGIRRLDWSNYLTPKLTFAVKVTGQAPALNHTHFTALQAQRGITTQQLKQFQERSSINPQAPDVQINLHLEKGWCTVSLDSSGKSLHRRGYRAAVGFAPLKESLAAALVKLSNWQPEQMFYDPMCGSGTLPLEASLISLNIAPGLFRTHFSFMTWLNANESLWESLKTTAKQQQQTTLARPIWGSDRDDEIIKQAMTNAQACGVADQVYLSVMDIEEIAAPMASGTLFFNPPYGTRLAANDPMKLGQLYQRIGQILKERFRGWTAFVLSGNKELAQTIGLKSSQRFTVYNGTIPCQLLKYELY